MSQNTLIEKVRGALGRSEALKVPPTPPAIDEEFARLTPKSADLTQRFVQSATEAKLKIERTTADKLGPKLLEWIQLHECKRIGIAASALLQRLGIAQLLRGANLE